MSTDSVTPHHMESCCDRAPAPAHESPTMPRAHRRTGSQEKNIWQEKGQSLLELALILPVLLTLLAGLADAGRALHTYMIITNAAREAVRYATIHPDDASGIINRGLDVAEQGGLDPAQVTVTATVGAPGEPAVVVVSTQFTPLFLGFIWDQPFTLSCSAQMVVL